MRSSQEGQKKVGEGLTLGSSGPFDITSPHFYTDIMEVHLRPETESRLQEMAAKTGRAPDELVEDAMAGYLEELAKVRSMLDSRYDDIKSGRVKPISGEEAFARLRRKSEQRRSRRS